MDIPKSSLNQMLKALANNGLILYDELIKSYTLGSFTWELASIFQENLSIHKISQPLLKNIRNNHDVVVQMAILTGVEVMYIAKYSSSDPIQLSSRVGSKLPAYATGLGKSLLACLSKEEINSLYKDDRFTKFTENTISSKKSLFDELNATKKRGYAIDLGEYTSKVCCISVPILGFNNKAVAAVSCSVINEDELSNKESILSESLTKLSIDLSNRLGSTDPLMWRQAY